MVRSSAGQVTGPLRFGVLGPLRAWLGESELDLGSPQQQAMLAVLLLVPGRTASMSEIVDSVWGEHPPKAAVATIRTYASRLRRVLEPDRGPGDPWRVLTSVGDGYALRIEPDAVDLHVLEGRIAEAERVGDPAAALDMLAGVLDMHEGATLAGLPGPFAQAQRLRLTELWLSTMERRFTLELAAGRPGEVISSAPQLVDRYPLRERLCELLMLALYRSGRQAEALGVFDGTRRVLADELGIDPGTGLRELHQRILEADPTLTPAPTAKPPVPGRRLVGRADELARLLRMLDTVGNGPAWAAVSGQPGIGKTRLAEELSASAAAAGFTVAWARCGEDGDAPPFWPLAQLVQQLDPKGGELATVEAELPNEDHQYALFAKVGCDLAGLVDRPTLFVLDDLQWADADSLRLLIFLALHLRDVPLAVVCTMRDHPGLENLIVTLVRRGAERIALHPLSVSDVAALVTDDDASELHARSGGNPFFLTELLRLPVEQRAATVPTAVGDVLWQRVEALGEPVREMLSVAAVGGDALDIDVLSRVLRRPRAEFGALVDEAVGDGIAVWVPGSPGHYRFAHDLIREAVLTTLPHAHRQRLHAEVATALRALPGRHPAEFAHHVAAAAPLVAAPVVYKAAVGAGRWYAERASYAEAARWFARAADAGVDRERRGEALRELAVALAAGGRSHETIGAVVEALDLALARHDRPAMVRIADAVTVGRGLWPWLPLAERPLALIARLERVLSELDEDDYAGRALVLTVLAIAEYYRAPGRARVLSRQALELAERRDDPELLGEVLMDAVFTARQAGHEDDPLEFCDRLLALPRPARSPLRDMAAYAHRAGALLSGGDIAGFDTAIAAARVAASSTDRPFTVVGLEHMLATRACIAGRFAEATAHLEAAERRHVESGRYRVAAVTAVGREQIALFRGDAPGVIESIGGGLDDGTLGWEHSALGAALRGDPEDARRILRQHPVAARLPTWLWLGTMLIRAEVTCLLRDTGLAAELLPRLRPFAGRLGVFGTTAQCIAPVSLALGRLALLTGDTAAAAADLRSALRTAEVCDSPPWRARSRWYLARTRADDAESVRLRTVATTEAVTLGMALELRPRR